MDEKPGDREPRSILALCHDDDGQRRPKTGAAAGQCECECEWVRRGAQTASPPHPGAGWLAGGGAEQPSRSPSRIATQPAQPSQPSQTRPLCSDASPQLLG